MKDKIFFGLVMTILITVLFAIFGYGERKIIIQEADSKFMLFFASPALYEVNILSKDLGGLNFFLENLNDKPFECQIDYFIDEQKIFSQKVNFENAGKKLFEVPSQILEKLQTEPDGKTLIYQVKLETDQTKRQIDKKILLKK